MPSFRMVVEVGCNLWWLWAVDGDRERRDLKSSGYDWWLIGVAKGGQK
jgi:hypothetical protein